MVVVVAGQLEAAWARAIAAAAPVPAWVCVVASAWEKAVQLPPKATAIACGGGGEANGGGGGTSGWGCSAGGGGPGAAAGAQERQQLW